MSKWAVTNAQQIVPGNLPGQLEMLSTGPNLHPQYNKLRSEASAHILRVLHSVDIGIPTVSLLPWT